MGLYALERVSGRAIFRVAKNKMGGRGLVHVGSALALLFFSLSIPLPLFLHLLQPRIFFFTLPTSFFPAVRAAPALVRALLLPLLCGHQF